jgi:cytochrome c oxidase subunit 1
VLAIGLLIVLVYTLVALKWGPVSGANPWHSRGFEWDTPSPPPPENYETTPVYTHGPHEYDQDAAPGQVPVPEPRHV